MPQIAIVGLQEGDNCRIITSDNKEVIVRAIVTRNGYTKLRIDMPDHYRAIRVPKRENGSVD